MGIGVSILFGIAIIVFLTLVIFYYRRKAVGKPTEQIAAAGTEEQQLAIAGVASNTSDDSPWSPFSDKSKLRQQQYQELETPTSVPLYELSTETETRPVEMEAPDTIHEAPSSSPRDSQGLYK